MVFFASQQISEVNSGCFEWGEIDIVHIRLNCQNKTVWDLFAVRIPPTLKVGKMLEVFAGTTRRSPWRSVQSICTIKTTTYILDFTGICRCGRHNSSTRYSGNDHTSIPSLQSTTTSVWSRSSGHRYQILNWMVKNCLDVSSYIFWNVFLS